MSENIGAVWITAITLLFIVITAYVITYPIVCAQLYDIAVDLAPVNTGAGYFTILSLIRLVYHIAPWILCFGILIWAYLSAQRREYETGY